ncbi:Uncharacterised protein [Roseomonas gilardii subsp. rosea]|nr:Uncharacterised protein [Roseomonas gilardii subsp. rosea]
MVTWKNALATTAATLALGAVLSVAPIAAHAATTPSASGQSQMPGHGKMSPTACPAPGWMASNPPHPTIRRRTA